MPESCYNVRRVRQWPATNWQRCSFSGTTGTVDRFGSGWISGGLHVDRLSVWLDTSHRSVLVRSRPGYQSIASEIDFGGSSTPSLFDTHMHVGLYYLPTAYEVSFQTKSLNFFSLFFQNFLLVFFFRVSCFVFHVLSHLTSHPILHSYPLHFIAARLGRTYMHPSIYPVERYPFDPRSFLFYVYPYIKHPSYPSIFSTYHHNTHVFHKSCLLIFCFLVFVSPGGLYNLHAMVNLSAG